MNASSFGARLRHEREVRGVTLESVAAATRISLRALAAIENNDWSRLPGGIFNRGFIRSIGNYLGMDSDALVAEYVAATNDAPQPRLLQPESPPAWSPIFWMAAALILVVALAAGGWAVYHHFRGRAAGNVPAHPAAIASPAARPAATLAAPVTRR